MTQKIYADASAVRDIVGQPFADQLTDSTINAACLFGSGMTDQLALRTNIPDDDSQYELFKQSSELFAAAMCLKRFGSERQVDAQADIDFATQICTAIVAANAEPEGGEEDLATETVSNDYTTYPASPRGEYFGMRRPRTAIDMILNDPHHDFLV